MFTCERLHSAEALANTDFFERDDEDDDWCSYMFHGYRFQEGDIIRVLFWARGVLHGGRDSGNTYGKGCSLSFPIPSAQCPGALDAKRRAAMFACSSRRCLQVPKAPTSLPRAEALVEIVHPTVPLRRVAQPPAQ